MSVDDFCFGNRICSLWYWSVSNLEIYKLIVSSASSLTNKAPGLNKKKTQNITRIPDTKKIILESCENRNEKM